MANKNFYPIRYVSRQTGLTAHLIRAWENRYRAVTPQRTDTNRRLYSDEDIEKLNLLKQAVKSGNAIGQIASLKKIELQNLAAHSDASVPAPETWASSETDRSSPLNHYESCVKAILAFDAEALENALNRAAIELNRMALLEAVVIPFIQRIGELWSEGRLKIYQEHMASSILRTFLGDMLRFSDIQPVAKNIVVATPAGQHHELGALIVAVAAVSQGWRITYLGVNLPSEEIAGAADQIQAKVVCLSIVFPADDPKLVFEIKKLRRYLSKDTTLIIGGQATGSYGRHLEAPDALIVENISEFLKKLKKIK
jgi:DNA-binding transcriptional MerR regulator/methylmalonyl-CoA mutase cobalamin-binding subunit